MSPLLAFMEDFNPLVSQGGLWNRLNTVRLNTTQSVWSAIGQKKAFEFVYSFFESLVYLMGNINSRPVS